MSLQYRRQCNAALLTINGWMTEHEILGHFSVTFITLSFFSLFFSRSHYLQDQRKQNSHKIHQIFIWERLQKTLRLFAFTWGWIHMKSQDVTASKTGAFNSDRQSIFWLFGIMWIYSFKQLQSSLCSELSERTTAKSILLCLLWKLPRFFFFFFLLNTSKVIVCINQVLRRWSLTLCNLWHGCNILFYPFILHPNKLKSWIKLHAVVSTIHVASSSMDMFFQLTCLQVCQDFNAFTLHICTRKFVCLCNINRKSKRYFSFCWEWVG